jgi:hypothetical protein
MQPRPESRIESLEKRASAIEAEIVEMSNDTAEELKVIHQDIKQLNERMQSGFLEIGALFDRNFDTLATLATKDDLTAVQGQIKEDTGTIETRLDRMETDITSMKATQEQILKLLQQKSRGEQ